MFDMPTLPDHPFAGPAAWIGRELRNDAGVVRLPPDSLDEIARLAVTLRDNPLPTLALDPSDFQLPACARVMTKSHAALKEGPGFVIIDRIPPGGNAARDRHQGLLVACVEGLAALDALTAIIDDQTLYKEFHFEPGQIQILDNRRLGHKRTEFKDWPEPNANAR
jgi:TfdA family taurine catabolism dioxygenase TauD